MFPTLSAGCQTVLSLHVFTPISAQPLMAVLLLSPPFLTPHPPKKNPGNRWRLPGQDPGDHHTLPAS